MNDEHDEAELREHPYEPPQVESVLTADELEREIQYAGFPGSVT